MDTYVEPTDVTDAAQKFHFTCNKGFFQKLIPVVDKSFVSKIGAKSKELLSKIDNRWAFKSEKTRKLIETLGAGWCLPPSCESYRPRRSSVLYLAKSSSDRSRYS